MGQPFVKGRVETAGFCCPQGAAFECGPSGAAAATSSEISEMMTSYVVIPRHPDNHRPPEGYRVEGEQTSEPDQPPPLSRKFSRICGCQAGGTADTKTLRPAQTTRWPPIMMGTATPPSLGPGRCRESDPRRLPRRRRLVRRHLTSSQPHVISASHAMVTCYTPFAPRALTIDQMCWGGSDGDGGGGGGRTDTTQASSGQPLP